MADPTPSLLPDSPSIVIDGITVKRSGRFLIRWECEVRINRIPYWGWGITPRAAIKAALDYRLSGLVIADLKAKEKDGIALGVEHG